MARIPPCPARGRVAEAADGRDARAAVDPCLASRGRLARRLPIPAAASSPPVFPAHAFPAYRMRWRAHTHA